MRKERFLILLFVILIYIIIDPILSPYPFGNQIIHLVSLLLFFSSINAISDTRRRFVAAVLLFACSVVAQLATLAAAPGFYNVLGRSLEFAFSAAFFSYAGLLIIGYVLKEGDVTRDKIAAAVCVYLILGIVWGEFYGLTETLDPGALGGLGDPASQGSGTVFYYSFVTLTTIGYGDITPQSPVTRSLAIVEGFTGQIYLAVMIARLVGLYTSRSSRKA